MVRKFSVSDSWASSCCVEIRRPDCSSVSLFVGDDMLPRSQVSAFFQLNLLELALLSTTSILL